MARPRSVSDASLMDLLKQGKRDKQIAYDLKLHPCTVTRLIADAVHRCGAKTRCQAVAIYLERKVG